MPILILASAVILLVAFIGTQPLFIERRRGWIRWQSFPQEWQRILSQRVPYFQQLPTELQRQLQQHIQVFIAEKPLIGCAGLVVNDEMRVTIAAQACLLLLNNSQAACFEGLRQVLLYPGAFVVERPHTDGAGVLRDQRLALAGESWSQGQVILSWEDVVAGAADVGDGRNVVIHEFAHQLDQESGPANGAPRLPDRRLYRTWSAVFSEEFRRLQVQVQAQLPTLLGDYAATSPAEFFAVASEVFFEQPHQRLAEHPALYAQLRGFYRIDPLSW